MDKKYMQVYHGLVSWYRHNCVDDAKILEDSINAGEAVSLFSTLLNDLFSAELKYEKLFHIARLFHFYDYCKSYNNGIPLLEIVGDMIDSSQKSKIINAVKSQKNLVEFLIREGADIVTLADYVADNETIEYAINEEKKSTGVLKRIIGRKQLISANPETEVNPKKRVKQIIGISDWCIVFYYLDEAGAKKGKKTDRMDKFIKENNVVNPLGKLTTIDSFKNKYHEIENRINGKNNKKTLSPEKIENILPYLKNNEKALKSAENDIKYLIGEAE